MKDQPQRGRTQRERSDATTSDLLRAARELFAERGFAATTLDEVAQTAGVTKGALYHHFDGKAALFRAVYELEQQHLLELSTEAFRRRRDPWRGFTDGCRAFVEASMKPDVARITLFDAPAALGWDEMRAIEQTGTLRAMVTAIGAAVDAGRIRTRHPEQTARLIFGAVCEATMAAARSPDPQAALVTTHEALGQLLDGLAVD